MEELEQELNNIGEETPEVETQVETETPQEQPQTEEEQQELWKQTKQYEQGLWKNPDDVYNSVKYYEQKFQPLEQFMKRAGFKEPSQLEQAYKDYQAKLPTYQENENTVNLLNALLQDDRYGSKIKAVFDEIRRSQEMERFGFAYDDLPQQVRERVSKGEQAFQELQEMKQQQYQQQLSSALDEQMQQIQKLSQDYGFDVDMKEILEYARDNNIPVENLYGEFLKSNFAQLVDKAKQNASLATTMQNKQNKAKSVTSSNKQGGNAPQKAINTISDLEQTILEKL